MNNKLSKSLFITLTAFYGVANAADCRGISTVGSQKASRRLCD